MGTAGMGWVVVGIGLGFPTSPLGTLLLLKKTS